MSFGFGPRTSDLVPSFPMSDLLIRTDGRVRTLTLNRPERRNALSHGLVAALRAALDEAERDAAVRCVVLEGAGKAFSAGADLEALRGMQTASSPENLADSAHLAGLFRQIYTLSKPVVARVHGAALGGGCGLAAVCDLAVADQEARLGFTEVRLGFVPAIVSVFAVRKIGEAGARDLMLTGRQLSGAEAAQMGLVARAVPADELDRAVATLAAEIAAETSASAVALTKRLLAAVPGMGLDEGIAFAVQANAFARTTPDFQAGITAFLDRTLPPWKSPEGV
jgi:methylglutaconyl-CoA hydratase